MGDSNTLVMPKLGLTMTEGTITAWQVEPGQAFAKGEILVVVESEKAAYEVEAPSSGVLERIVAAVSETVPVGAPIARWHAEGGAARPAQAPGDGAPETAPAARPCNGGKDLPAGQPRKISTPLARRLARQHGIDIGAVEGSGPRKRVQARDIEALVPAPPPRSEARVVPPSAAGRTMAERTARSKQEIPHFYLSLDVDAGPLFALRDELNALPDRPRVSVTHLLVAAIVQALRECPAMNRVWTDDGIRTLDGIEVGLAIDSERGLTSPVARDLAEATLYGMVGKIDALIARARGSGLGPGDFGGGAITLSNAGMHRVRYMTSIIVPGQSAILGVGSLQELFRPGPDGQPLARRELGLTLSADHRIHTGVAALAFLGALERALTHPLLLLTGK